MSNLYLTTTDGLHWQAQDSGRKGDRKYRFYRMEKGYHQEMLLEKQFIDKYPDILQQNT